jgi:hypothetical protein
MFDDKGRVLDENGKPRAVYRDTFYPLADEPMPRGYRDRLRYRAVATGEYRDPRKGEWFLSGSTVEAYYAPADGMIQYAIARLVKGTMQWVPDDNIEAVLAVLE